MGKIFLNEGTELKVKETKEEIKKLIQEKISSEYMLKKWEFNDNFIEVTVEGIYYPSGDLRQSNFENGNKIDLYAKRILFIYD